MQAQRSLESLDIEKDELKAILNSRYFFRSPSLAHFLSYICEKYFQGESDQIKEYSIAVDAFGRSADFHPKEDPIVRVEASRLRKRLKEYYSGEGSYHAVQLTLPPGQYIPVFQYLDRTEAHDLAPLQSPTELESLDAIEPAGLVVSPKNGVSIPGEQSPVSRDRQHRWMFSLIWLGVGLVLGGAAVFWFPRILQDRKQQPEPAAAIPQEPPSLINLPAPSKPMGEVRIRVGSLGKKYIDQMGKIWSEDQFFSGGVGLVRETLPF